MRERLSIADFLFPSHTNIGLVHRAYIVPDELNFIVKTDELKKSQLRKAVL